jgi:hypothetical protein
VATYTLQPTRIREAIYWALLNDVTTAGLVGRKIYPDYVPEVVILPAVTYQVESNVRGHHLGGPDGVTRARVLVAAVSKNLTDCTALTRAFLSLFDAYPANIGTVSCQVTVIECVQQETVETYEPATDGTDRGTYRLVSDFMIRYREP